MHNYLSDSIIHITELEDTLIKVAPNKKGLDEIKVGGQESKTTVNLSNC